MEYISHGSIVKRWKPDGTSCGAQAQAKRLQKRARPGVALMALDTVDERGLLA